MIKHLIDWSTILLVLAIVMSVACTSVGSTASDSRTGQGVVVMQLGGADVERYENDRVVCFKWGGGHGSVNCYDKAAAR